jgi:predicted SnoaL-like aldol condensation-catalyzing enzyme
MQEKTASRKEKAMSFLKLASAGQVEQAYGTYLTEDSRHHSPHFSGETDVLAAAMKENADEHPKKVFEIQRTLEDGDVVAVHSRVRLDPTT